ncbi:aminoacyl-tRNA hydrolase [bacterium C-53]|nr:aminoacyl-tRNA hydrolase [Lachnospiraceae bacterium]NBI04283.1 aminoacyl-tRNA hydrolase [Lachnospiraceae bacterium]RKJ08454.1 aminoacyl-tRNA hydrolase [bacterium C-53]
MYIIVGLGNPTKEYKNTRHNIGFDVIDTIAKENNIDVSTKKFKALIGKGIVAGQKVVLAKPLTYMNLSGESVRELVDYYKISVEDELIVLFDDVSLDVGQIRIRKKGSAGGHNGVKSIIAHVNTQEFKRIKIGVGEKPKAFDLANYVLGHFSKEEREIMDESALKAEKAVGLMVQNETDQAMNLYNKKSERHGD